jgi:hypothetical protein
MKDKAKHPQNAVAAKNAEKQSQQRPAAQGPAKEYETHKSPAKPGDDKPKRLGESETEIDDETTI